jgi:hypothetical protein
MQRRSLVSVVIQVFLGYVGMCAACCRYIVAGGGWHRIGTHRRRGSHYTDKTTTTTNTNNTNIIIVSRGLIHLHVYIVVEVVVTAVDGDG